MAFNLLGTNKYEYIYIMVCHVFPQLCCAAFLIANPPRSCILLCSLTMNHGSLVVSGVCI